MAVVNRNQSRPIETGADRVDLSFLIPVEWLPWARVAVILGALGMAAGLGFLITKRNPAYGLLAAAMPLVVLSVMFMILHLKYAPAVILFVAAFVPVSLPTGTGSRLVLSLVFTTLFVGLWLLRMWLVDKRFHLKVSSANVPALGFIVVVLVSVVWSNVFVDPLVYRPRSFAFVQVASTVVMVMLPGTFLLAGNLVDSLKTMKVMVGMLLVAGVIGLVKQYEIVDFPFNVGGLYTTWIIALSTGLAMFGRRLGLVWRGLFLALAGVWVVWGAILNISWVSGWLPGMAALVVLISLRSKKLAVLTAVVMFVVVQVNQVYYAQDVQQENQVSGQTRLAAWKQNWQVTSQHLLFGTGPAGYAAYYMTYFPTEAMATHNNYIDILAETGLIGFAFYIGIFVIAAWKGYHLCRRLKGRGDFAEALANSLLAGTVACIVAMALGDWLIPFAYTQTIAGFDHSVFSWLFMGLIFVLDRLTQPRPEAALHA
jgi:O-antigen ligase